MTEINIPLLRKTLEYAAAHHEEVDLTVWANRTACGTVACVAGWAAILAGHDIDWDTTAPLSGSVYLTTNGDHIAEIAAQELGLTEEQENQLFYCASLDAVWEAAERLTNGEIQRSP